MSKNIPFDDLLTAARASASKLDADVYLYNGPIGRGHDLLCIDNVSKAISRDKALLCLVTGGGDPDAAYKVSRYFQDKYDNFTVLVSGFCKSAGTLIALGAHELAFMPFGELGPLDIQLGKVDKFDAPQSGLAIQEALDTLESRARKSFDNIVEQYMEDNWGLLSFPAASHAALEFVTQLYAPIFARIDPEEVGARSRSMQIAHQYGQRLAVRSRNLKPATLTTLAEKYSSHSFVIDRREATSLFNNVRDVTDAEKRVVIDLGPLSRFPMPRNTGGGAVTFEVLSSPAQAARKPTDGQVVPRRRATRNGASSPGNAKSAKPLANGHGKRLPRPPA